MSRAGVDPTVERTLFKMIQLVMHDRIQGPLTRESFADGQLFVNIVKKIGDLTDIKDVVDKPTTKTQRKQNVTSCLKILKQCCVLTGGAKAEDIIAGNDKLVKVMEGIFIFGLNKNLNIKGHKSVSSDVIENFKAWLNDKLNPDIHINNFTGDWYSGTYLGALIDHLCPGLCPDWRLFKAVNNMDTVTRLMHLAEDNFQVYRLISPKDMCDPHVDPLTIVMYLSQFVDAFAFEEKVQRTGSIGDQTISGGSIASLGGPVLPLTTTSGVSGPAWIGRSDVHPNVISMVGYITLEPQVGTCKLLPVKDQRDLLNHLRSKRIGVTQLLHIAMDITKGTKYITDHGVSLPTLTTRNCLLSEDKMTVMVADYRSVNHILPHDYRLETSDRYQPWRWQALEYLTGDTRPTTMAHVWSLAVVFHELFTGGRQPYVDIHTEHQLREWLNQGRRLEKPKSAPDAMYQLMINCWSKSPRERPTFDEIHRRLQQMIANSGRPR